MNLSFKEFYLQSRQQLVEAASQTPVKSTTYTVTKYCTFFIEDGESRKLVGLRPKHTVTIEWKYDNQYDPTPISVSFSGSKDAEDDVSYKPAMSSKRISKWLSTNTQEGSTDE